MYFTLPDLQGICPFPPAINPHYDVVVPGSSAWAKSFGILSPKKLSQLAASPPELLAAHVCPYASLEGLRTCCYLANIIFLLDDFSDDECGSGARAMSNSFMNAARDPSQDDGTRFAHLAKEYVDSPLSPVLFPNTKPKVQQTAEHLPTRRKTTVDRRFWRLLGCDCA